MLAIPLTFFSAGFTIQSQFLTDRREREEEDKQRVTESIDELQYLIKDYRSSERFIKMMNFIGHFHYLAPYNAMLVERQKPGASFVLSAKKWERDFLRRPTINAQQLITLVPGGPVQFMFDFSDTEPIQGVSDETANEKVKLMEEYENQFNKTQGKVDEAEWENLKKNLPSYGIILDQEFNAASSYGGYLLACEDRSLKVRVRKDCQITVKSRYYLSVNKNQTPEAKFVTICHELGHLFCRHLFYDRYKERNISHKVEEFEAESVAWLMCKRRGITNPSEEYLASYSKNGEIPICSMDFIMKAVTEIEKMLGGIVPIKKSLWYSNDDKFKKIIDEISKMEDRPAKRTLVDGVW